MLKAYLHNMKFIYATDIHGDQETYEKILEYALNNGISSVVFGGDICYSGFLNIYITFFYKQRHR